MINRYSRLFFQFTVILMLCCKLIGETESSNVVEVQPVKHTRVYVVPINGQIMPAHLFILRRALKEAIAENIQTVVLDIHTPGGSLETTLEMMNVLEKFQGNIIAYVNTEAISAGSYLAIAADKIYFAPTGIMGAAAVIESTGQEISSTLRKKIDSYLKARIRNLSQDYPYRGDVQRAMMDEDFVFQIEDTILKDKGELLSLTAKEAIKTYGNPEQNLLAEGIVPNIKTLLDAELGKDTYTIQAFEITGAEQIAKLLQSISPILLGLGLMLLFIEFKTPGFGWIGALGIGCLLAVFISNHIAGLAGYEAVVLFGLAIICFFLELFVFSGFVIMGVIGFILLVIAFLWSMSDVWPTYQGGIEWDFSMLVQPLWNLLFGMGLAIAGILLLLRFLPKTTLWNKLVLSAHVKDTFDLKSTPKYIELKGKLGVALTDLRPTGCVEIEDKSYEARVAVGIINRGEGVEVVEARSTQLIVRKV